VAELDDRRPVAHEATHVALGGLTGDHPTSHHRRRAGELGGVGVGHRVDRAGCGEHGLGGGVCGQRGLTGLARLAEHLVDVQDGTPGVDFIARGPVVRLDRRGHRTQLLAREPAEGPGEVGDLHGNSFGRTRAGVRSFSHRAGDVVDISHAAGNDT
jgi:hypothetical protein